MERVGLTSFPYLPALVVCAMETCWVCVIEVSKSLGSLSSTKWPPLLSSLKRSAFGIDWGSTLFLRVFEDSNW